MSSDLTITFVNITINGQPRKVEQPATVADLLEQLKIPLRGTAVELNLQVLPRACHTEHQLADGDRLEIVSLVGGG